MRASRLIGNSDAVRLFVDRATAVQRAFTLDEQTAGPVADICRHLDGVPLAIELAAARVAVMSPSQIAGLLDDRFQLLTSGRRTAAERHQTLLATVDWSYALLTPEEQAVFDGLGVLVGTFDAETVAAVVDPGADRWRMLDSLTSLVAKSMVLCEDVSGGPPRYRLLETLRQYALERLEDRGDADTLRRRFAEHEVEFAETAGAALLGPDELAWRPRLRAEFDALRATVQWALESEHGDDAELGVRVAAALAPYAVHEAAGDIAAIAEMAIPLARTSTPGRRASVLGSAAFASFQNKGDFALAEALATEALRDGLGEDCTDPASAYASLVMVLTWTGRIDEGRRVLAEAFDALEATDANQYSRAILHQTAAAVLSMTGDVEEARASASDALARARQVGSPSEMAAALWTACLTTIRDRPDEALEFAEEAVSLILAGASGSVFGHVMAMRAELRARSGDAAGAGADLREALTYSRTKGDQVMLAVGLDRGILVFGHLGRPEAVAVLSGAVGPEGALGVLSTLPLAERGDRDALVQQERTQSASVDLGPEAFDAAVARGAAMSPDEIVAYVVAEIERLTGETA